MLRKLCCVSLLALVAMPLAHAAGGRELKITGEVVRASAQAVSVENLVGDAVLTCVVPARLADKAAALKPGDRIRMICVRFKGKKAELRLLLRAGERKAEPKPEPKPKPESKPESKPDKPAGEEVRIYGKITALSRDGVTVQGDAGAHTCRPPAGLAEKLARFALGDSVKMMCRGTELTYLEKTA